MELREALLGCDLNGKLLSVCLCLVSYVVTRESLAERLVSR